MPAMIFPLFFLKLTLLSRFGYSRLQPLSGGSSSWSQLPTIHPIGGSRSTETTILVTWSIADHEIETIGHYKIRVRFPIQVAESERVYLPKYSNITAAFPETVVNNREWAVSWSPWYVVYAGLGRQFMFDTSHHLGGVVNRRYFDFQVSAVTAETTIQSPWSNAVQGYTVLEGTRDRVIVELTGTGRNNVGLTKVLLAGQTLLNRADLIGLTLFVLDRRDLSVAFTQTYNTYASELEARNMAQKIRSYGPNFFILVVSSGAWEWHATPTLTDILEDYGAYYFGQWSRVFGADTVQYSPYADLAETSSQDSFGHPYAFFGWYGLGAGGGFESLQLNTGHYLVTGKAAKAIIRLELYYSYMFEKYMVSSNREILSAEFFTKGQSPQPGTVYAPLPLVGNPPPVWQVQPVSLYSPYIGNLWAQLEYLMEANETFTVPEYNVTNYGFEIVQRLVNRPAQVSNDPRTNVLTELERIWGGPSLRYSNVSSGTLLGASASAGTVRVCPNVLANRWNPGTGCAVYDATGANPLLQFGVGVWPSVCYQSICGDSIVTSFYPLIGKPTDITDINTQVTVNGEVWN
jgi:hypothetical protein